VSLAKAVLLTGKVATQTDTEQAFVREWRTYRDSDAMDVDPLGCLVANAIARKVGFDELLSWHANKLRVSLESFTLGANN
jgi:hypothetical protein